MYVVVYVIVDGYVGVYFWDVFDRIDGVDGDVCGICDGLVGFDQ